MNPRGELSFILTAREVLRNAHEGAMYLEITWPAFGGVTWKRKERKKKFFFQKLSHCEEQANASPKQEVYFQRKPCDLNSYRFLNI